MHSIQKVLPILLLVAGSGFAGPVMSRRVADILARNHDEYYSPKEEVYGHRHEDHREQGGLANGGDAGDGGYGGDGGNGGYIKIAKGGHYYARRNEHEQHRERLANGGLGGHGGNGGNGGYGGKIDRHGGFHGEGHGEHDKEGKLSEGNGGHGGFGGNGGHGGNGGEIHEEFQYGGHYRRRGLQEELNIPQLLGGSDTETATGATDIFTLDGTLNGVLNNKNPETEAFEKVQEAASRKAVLDQIAKENEQQRQKDAAASGSPSPEAGQQRRASEDQDLELNDLTSELSEGPLLEANEADAFGLLDILS